MNDLPLPSLEILSGNDPDASILWLHGLGADGHDFAPIVQELELPLSVRFILPHAPVRPITVNGGYPMPGWYDIASGDLGRQQDAAGIQASQAVIETLIEREKQRGVAAARILLAGFSQGGAIALHTGLRHRETLGGILALSTYLPLQSLFQTERSPANAGCPIFMGHGLQDTVIPMATAMASKQLLDALDYRVQWHEYRMPHSVCQAEIADIRQFILQQLQY